MSSPNGDNSGDQGNNSSTNTGDILGDVGNTIGSAISGAASTAGSAIAGPVTGWINGLEADVLNVLNQSFNSFFYGLVAVVGGGLMIWGIYELFKDTNVGQGLRSTVGAAVGLAVPEAKAASVAKKATTAPKTPAAPTGAHSSGHHQAGSFKKSTAATVKKAGS